MRLYEFNLWREGNEERFGELVRRVRELEQWKRDHEREHDQDEEEQVAQDRERRRERWRQFAAWMAVAAVLIAAWWTSAATR